MEEHRNSNNFLTDFQDPSIALQYSNASGSITRRCNDEALQRGRNDKVTREYKATRRKPRTRGVCLACARTWVCTQYKNERATEYISGIFNQIERLWLWSTIRGTLRGWPWSISGRINERSDPSPFAARNEEPPAHPNRPGLAAHCRGMSQAKYIGSSSGGFITSNIDRSASYKYCIGE